MVQTDIIIEAAGWESVPDLEELTEKIVRQCVATTGAALAPDCELSVTFCDDRQIRALNAEWRGIDKPTNVLSFPTPGELARKPLLGDIVIAHETVAREAAEQGKPLLDHVGHMVAHGFLHLVGYDHERREDAEVMEALERRIAAAVGLSDPYDGSEPEEDGAQVSGPKKVHVNEA